MKRKELFEFEDFHWVPSTIRTAATNLIMVFHKMMGSAAVISNKIKTLKAKHQFQQIVDLGSGSGGPMIDVLEDLNKEDKQLSLVLSDLHPNAKRVAAINNHSNENLSYHETAVNATNIDQAPKGLKTMIASFHHMNPTIAQKILLSAQESKSPILIYEVAKNNVPFIVWLLLLPLSLSIVFIMALVLTWFVRPLNWRQIVFTYLIPAVPLLYAWDGQASLMRTYTFEDIESLLKGHRSPDYEWTISDALKDNGKKAGYFIIGEPKK